MTYVVVAPVLDLVTFVVLVVPSAYSVLLVVAVLKGSVRVVVVVIEPSGFATLSSFVCGVSSSVFSFGFSWVCGGGVSAGLPCWSETSNILFGGSVCAYWSGFSKSFALAVVSSTFSK